ncbi:UNVERIFIED_ORG: hypothetical protein HNP28_002060 [Comamonas terrigena]
MSTAPAPHWQADTVVLHAGYDGLQHEARRDI